MAANPEYKEVNADDMTMYYDEKLKRWVDPNDADSMKPVEAVAPPPTTAAAPAPAPNPAGDVTQTTPLKPDQVSNDLMAPPPSFRRRKSTQKRPSVTANAYEMGGAGTALVTTQSANPIALFVPGSAVLDASDTAESAAQLPAAQLPSLTAAVEATPERPAFFMPPTPTETAESDAGVKSKKKKKAAGESSKNDNSVSKQKKTKKSHKDVAEGEGAVAKTSREMAREMKMKKEKSKKPRHPAAPALPYSDPK